MSIVFEKSPIRSAFDSSISAVIAMIVGGLFAGLLWFVQDLPLIVKIASVIAVLISIIMTVKIVSEGVSYFKRGEAWRVVIDSNVLSWTSPDPDFMESFELNLSDIHTVRSEVHIRKNSKASPRHKFYLDLTDGSSMEIKFRLSAINPVKVFKALEQQGVTYSKNVIREGSNIHVTVS